LKNGARFENGAQDSSIKLIKIKIRNQNQKIRIYIDLYG